MYREMGKVQHHSTWLPSAWFLVRTFNSWWKVGGQWVHVKEGVRGSLV